MSGVNSFKEWSTTTHHCRQFADALHHAPQHRADHQVGKQQAGRTGLGVGGAGSDEQAGPDAAGEADHGHLVVTQPALGAAMAADVELRLLDRGLLVLVVGEGLLLDVLDRAGVRLYSHLVNRQLLTWLGSGRGLEDGRREDRGTRKKVRGRNALF